MEAGFLIFWLGALAIAGFVALPVVLGIQKLKRRLGRFHFSAWAIWSMDTAWPTHTSSLFRSRGRIT